MAEQTERILSMDSESNEASSVEASGTSSIIKIIAIGLLLTMLVIGFLQYKYNLITQVAMRFLGPPQVELKETFSISDANGIFDHATFQNMLSVHVDADGWVDYQAIKNDETTLDAYLQEIANADLNTLGRDERLAFLINAYNAFTVKLIVENYPLTTIKDIPSEQRWDAVRWDLAGSIVSLSQIEHELIRPNFVEPRVHFALVCAAIGCPPLRNEVFTGETLEAQLSEQSNYVHQHATWFQFNETKNELSLTQLYNWYGNDFVQAEGSLLGFVSKYSPEVNQHRASIDPNGIIWLPYDWTLNDTKNQIPR